MIAKLPGLLVLIGILFSAYFVIDKRYALSETVRLIEQRQDYWITYDQFKATREQIRDVEKEYENKQMPLEKKQELDQLKEDKEMLKEKMKNLETK